MMKRLARLLTLLLLFVGTAEAETLQGHVYRDANGNGRFDAGEKGVADVAVSNGRAIVRTDAQGRYVIDVAPGQTVFVIKPAGEAFTTRGNGLPAFWQQYQPTPSTGFKYGGLQVDARTTFDIALRQTRGTLAHPLTVTVLADPQPKSIADVDYYARDVAASIRQNGESAHLGVSLGDIVDDDLSLYPAMNAVTRTLRTPWLHIAGNHDVDIDAGSDCEALQTYRNTFGPDTFAWEEPQAVFIGLDDVISTFENGRHRYIGGLRDDQFAFLEAYVPTVPNDRLLVLMVHIPLFEPTGKDTFRDADRARLFALLAQHPRVLLLSGHNHTQQHVFHTASTGWHGAQPLHEYNVGAACGAFWSGVKDAAGIPDASMADGTPNGYATLTVQARGDYALRWTPARDAAKLTMHLHAPRVLRRGAYPAWGVYANVYMGMDDTRVEFRVDGGDWQPMTKVLQPDPRVLAENRRDDEAATLRGYDRSPEVTPSPHLWRGALPTRIAAGVHRVEVRAIDRWRGEQVATLTYRLDAAAP